MTRRYSLKRKHYPSTPFTIWLYDYANKNKTSLADLAVKAGLARGLLNIYVAYPRRKPSLKTCLWLSEVTGKPAGEILKLAGIAGYKEQKTIDLDLEELVKVYRGLPAPMKRYLLKCARALDYAIKTPKSYPSQGKQRR
jgi:hypothetical protein